MVLGAVPCTTGSFVTDEPCTSSEPGLNTTEGLCNGEEEKNGKTGGNVCGRKPRNEKKVRKREKKEKRDRTLRTDRNM